MTYWIYPWNEKQFDLYGCLEEFGFIEWRQKNKVSKGDYVLIYACGPIFRATHIFEILETDIPYSARVTAKYASSKEPTKFYSKLAPIAYLDPANDSFSRENLLQLGMPKNMQQAIKAKPQIINLINDHIEESEPDCSEETPEYEEGLLRYRKHKEYERNVSARMECLKLKGYSCDICGMNFEETYGSLGKGFIEVHHLDFLSNSKGNLRKTNIATELIPVCSNCHSMLHRRINDRYLTPGELKECMAKTNY